MLPSLSMNRYKVKSTKVKRNENVGLQFIYNYHKFTNMPFQDYMCNFRLIPQAFPINIIWYKVWVLLLFQGNTHITFIEFGYFTVLLVWRGSSHPTFTCCQQQLCNCDNCGPLYNVWLVLGMFYLMGSFVDTCIIEQHHIMALIKTIKMIIEYVAWRR